MCVRFFIDRDSKRLRELAETANVSPLADRFRSLLASPILQSGEVGPASVTPAIALNKKEIETVFPMQWGFSLKPPAEGQTLPTCDVFNARAETAGEKRAFAPSWRSRRCIIPASWYFEWEHIPSENGRKRTGERWSIRPKNGKEVFLCGLYRMEAGLPKFVVLTRAPTAELARIHDRMPLILPEEKTAQWIDPGVKPEEMLCSAVTDLEIWRKSV
jgi:putative SOS response-associated peptidase YedK